MGKVKNTGVELELRARLYSDRNWLFQLYGSFARNKNTIIEISQAMRDYNKRVEELFSGYNPESSSDSKYAKTYLKYYERSLSDLYLRDEVIGNQPHKRQRNLPSPEW